METNDLPVKGIDEHGQNLIDWAPLGYQALDADGRFLMVNEAWLETLGYRREEVIGKWFGDFLAGEYVEAFRQRFALFKAAGKIHSEFEMLHKSGQRRFIAFDGRIERQPEGGFGKTHCILQDITERKRAEEELRKSEKRFRLLVESAPEAIFVQTHQRFAYVNEATLRLFGGKVPGDLLGQLLESRFHPDIRQIIRERTRIINEEKLPVPRLEEMVLRLDGTLVPVEASAVPIHYEGIDGGLSFLRDITQRKQAEEKLRRQTNVTEAINRVLQASIQATRDEEVGRICLTAAEELTRSQFGWIGEINPMGRLDTIAMSNPGWEACRIPGIKWSAIRNMEIRGIFGRVLTHVYYFLPQNRHFFDVSLYPTTPDFPKTSVV
jgi:PAS domain S-box-containing protein